MKYEVMVAQSGWMVVSLGLDGRASVASVGAWAVMVDDEGTTLDPMVAFEGRLQLASLCIKPNDWELVGPRDGQR